MPVQADEAYCVRARWVLPVDREPIENGVVTVKQGRILSIGSRQSSESCIDLGNVALLPGFVNAHTHLEFSSLTSPLGEPGLTFPDWIGRVVAWRRSLAERLGSESTEALTAYQQEAVQSGLRESFQAGVTALGEIATSSWHSAAFAGEQIPKAIIFLELLGLSAERIEPLWHIAQQHTSVSGSLCGLSPHAPYTVHPELLQRVCELSRTRKYPVAMHLAESPEELELLRSQSGSLVERLKQLAAWHPSSLPRGIGPLDYLEMLARADRSLVIHGNFLSAEEIDFVAQRRDRMSIVYCPRTQAAFPFGEYPLSEMLARGARVAVGTDSRASNPDLCVLSELRYIAHAHPQCPPASILKMGTIAAAEALGIENEFGSLTPGKAAAMAIVPLVNESGDPNELVLRGEAAPRSLQAALSSL